MKLQINIVLFFTAVFALTCNILNGQELYVGANYHPHDAKNPEKWKNDIQLMEDAGFKVVRLGHLAWDSYEPSEGKFDFQWFDQVMDMMNQAGIKVILDIAVRPAPIWLQHKYPSISITDANGNLQYPNHRYMEDVGDSMYQKYAFIYTDTLTKRYAKHPALIAFGIDNESGDGTVSYSETVKQRYISWLKKKYTAIDNLNKAWASQRWSRRIGDFNEIGLPVSGSIQGPPERVLDFRLFLSDEISGFLTKIIDIVNINAPHALTNSNIWYYSDKYFDYSTIAYSGKMTRGGCGFYPGSSLTSNTKLVHSLFGISRIQFENTTPFWCNEFTSMTAVPKSIRKSAYATLMYGNQMVCGWTWQSMHGGEEQYFEGMMDWDGFTNRKYDEYKQIATELKKIEKYGFPYKIQAEVALAFSFPSQIVSYGFPERHDGQLETCFNQFFMRNMDSRLIEVSRSDLKYKLLVVPGVAVMDEKTATKIREFVNTGGVVIMTGFSAVVDDHNHVFEITHPGRLSDVFGIRIGSFEETENMNELSRDSYKGKKLRVNYKGKDIDVESARFDVIESRGAEVLGKITSLEKEYPVVTSNKYGQGRAIYIGLPARGELLSPMIDELISELSIKKGPEVPQNVMARFINSKHILYLNISNKPKVIELKGKSTSILYNKEYADKFTIAPFEPEFIELK